MIPTQNDSVPTDVLYENNGDDSNLYCLTILMDFMECHGFISPCSVPSTTIVCCYTHDNRVESITINRLISLFVCCLMLLLSSFKP